MNGWFQPDWWFNCWLALTYLAIFHRGWVAEHPRHAIALSIPIAAFMYGFAWVLDHIAIGWSS